MHHFLQFFMDNPTAVYQSMAIVMILTGIVVAICLQKWHAMYGRYATSSNTWILGPNVPARLAWFAQECPAVIVPVVLCLFAPILSRYWTFPLGLNRNTLLLGLFLLHYTQRSFLFPILIRGGKPTPLLIMLLAAVFCAYNGLMQYLALTSTRYTDTSMLQPNVIIGVVLFFAGMFINIHADAELRSLRKDANDTSYKIPRRGMFRYVTAANYFGETVEWLGYALACSNLAGWAFLIFTACNLAPRAVQHHAWYKKKFNDYPRDRAAFLPYVL